jgi:hypothetical protein
MKMRGCSFLINRKKRICLRIIEIFCKNPKNIFYNEINLLIKILKKLINELKIFYNGNIFSISFHDNVIIG